MSRENTNDSCVRIRYYIHHDNDASDVYITLKAFLYISIFLSLSHLLSHPL